MEDLAARARRLWQLYEPWHAVTYFSAPAREATEAIGLRGFWRGYFATRLAPLGPVEAPPAVAVLYGFAPPMVERAVPSIWALTSPDQAIAARLEGAGRTLAELTTAVDPDDLAYAAALAERLARTIEPAGRPLFAANAALPWPGEPHRRLWHATTLLREHRGDGHVAALVAADLDPVESLVSHAAAEGLSSSWQREARGWTETQWQAAEDRLADRGWLRDGEITEAGQAGRAAIEAATDRAAARALTAVSGVELDEFERLLAIVVAPVVASAIVPYPNPIGVRKPAPANRI